jgi:hypothetical protein
MVAGGAGMFAKMLGAMSRLASGIGMSGCIDGIMAAADLDTTCNTHDGCIILPDAMGMMVCSPDAGAPAPARPDAGGGVLGGGTCDNSEHTAPSPWQY